MELTTVNRMRKGLVFAVAIVMVGLYGCAKMMEDQPGTADSTQLSNDSLPAETASAAKPAKVPERFLTFYNKEFTGTVGVTGGATHSVDVEMVMDVTVELRSDADVVFMVKKDGIDITEAATKNWSGRLVPGRYMFAVVPGAKSTKFEPYTLSIREE